MSILGDWIRDKYRGEPAIGPLPKPDRDPLPGKILLPIVDEYEPLIDSGSTSSWNMGMITTVCTTAMEDYPILRLPETNLEPIIEWKCKSCGSVNLKEHRACEECGSPRHFIYGAGDDR